MSPEDKNKFKAQALNDFLPQNSLYLGLLSAFCLLHVFSATVNRNAQPTCTVHE